MKEIQLTKGYVTQVDDEDYERLIKFKWHASDSCNTKKPFIRAISAHGYMARMIVNCPRDKVVDHIDRNPLNNQKANIRICTRSENQRNKTIVSKSGYLGVTKVKNRWMAQITSNGKNNYLGLFSTEWKAAKAYNKAAREMHGEYANLNVKKPVSA